MSIEKFRDEAIAQTLYEYQSGGEVGLMLKQDDANSNLNQKMSRFVNIACWVSDGWKGKYHKMLYPMAQAVQVNLLQLDAFAREQAIEMVRAKSAALQQQQADEKKKGGILGLLS